MRAILFISFAFCFAGCKTKVPVKVLTNRTDSVYINKLLPYPLPADSASIRALMECDENGRVVLRWLDLATTKNVRLAFELDSLGKVIADMTVNPDTLYLRSEKTFVVKEVEVPVPVEKRLTRWERIKMEAGGWAIGLLSGCLAIGIVCVLKRLRGRRA